ncbi:MAG: hypothetical protein U1E46_08290 [Hyphomicrobiales bacterium]
MLKRVGRPLLIVLIAVMALPEALLIKLAIREMLSFRDSSTLPNGTILKREYDYDLWSRHDLFARDGKTLLVRNVDVVCFDDRYVLAYGNGGSGTYDGPDGRDLSFEEEVEVGRNGLETGRGCNGYYTGMLGPDLLYPENSPPFLPPCSWVNYGNTSLKHREWLERPCDGSMSANPVQPREDRSSCGEANLGRRPC